MTSLVSGDLAPPEAHEEVRLLVEPTLPHGSTAAHEPTVPHGQTGPGSLVAPQGGDPADTDEGGTSPLPYGPATRRTVSAGPDVGLGPLGWLAVLLVAALLTVLAHAGSVRSGQGEHREPSLLSDPAFVIAKSAE
ncbi:MAG: hypothetical protein F4X38_02335 [Acidimicrobiaceae bacterium]|nr:hypothetical protein [Acidimicrobiaceae bacterium]